MHAQIWATPRAHHLQALSLLDSHGSAAQHQDIDVELRQSISTRLAIIAAIEGHVVEARTLPGPDAPKTDASLLNHLGDIAHDELYEDFIAVALLHRAHEMDSHNPSILADLAEAYFAAGQMQQFAHAIARIDQRRASPGARAQSPHSPGLAID